MTEHEHLVWWGNRLWALDPCQMWLDNYDNQWSWSRACVNCAIWVHGEPVQQSSSGYSGLFNRRKAWSEFSFCSCEMCCIPHSKRAQCTGVMMSFKYLDWAELAEPVMLSLYMRGIPAQLVRLGFSDIVSTCNYLCMLTSLYPRCNSPENVRPCSDSWEDCRQCSIFDNVPGTANWINGSRITRITSWQWRSCWFECHYEYWPRSTEFYGSSIGDYRQRQRDAYLATSARHKLSINLNFNSDKFSSHLSHLHRFNNK